MRLKSVFERIAPTKNAVTHMLTYFTRNSATSRELPDRFPPTMLSPSRTTPPKATAISTDISHFSWWNISQNAISASFVSSYFAEYFFSIRNPPYSAPPPRIPCGRLPVHIPLLYGHSPEKASKISAGRHLLPRYQCTILPNQSAKFIYFQQLFYKNTLIFS